MINRQAIVPVTIEIKAVVATAFSRYPGTAESYAIKAVPKAISQIKTVIMHAM